MAFMANDHEQGASKMKNTTHRRGSKWLMAAFALGVFSLTADNVMPQGQDDVANLIAAGKLEAELGRSENAVDLFAQAAAKPAATENQRGEALARLGVEKRAMGDVRGSAEAFEQAAKVEDAEVRRLLTLAVAGVIPGQDRWKAIWSNVRLKIDKSDPDKPRPWIVWPQASQAALASYVGKPVSMTYQDIELWNYFRLVADITELNVVVWPGIPNSLMTMRQHNVPWDQILDQVLRSLGYVYTITGNVVTIAKPEDLPAPRQYTGKSVNIYIKDEPLTSVFRRFEKIGNVKIQADPDVAGKVYIKFHEVPWDQAFHIILRTQGLDYQREGDVIRIVRRSKIQ
jgi:tetratricopeptide (TPR) repeat protein